MHKLLKPTLVELVFVVSELQVKIVQRHPLGFRYSYRIRMDVHPLHL